MEMQVTAQREQIRWAGDQRIWAAEVFMERRRFSDKFMAGASQVLLMLNYNEEEEEAVRYSRGGASMEDLEHLSEEI